MGRQEGVKVADAWVGIDDDRCLMVFRAQAHHR